MKTPSIPQGMHNVAFYEILEACCQHKSLLFQHLHKKTIKRRLINLKTRIAIKIFIQIIKYLSVDNCKKYKEKIINPILLGQKLLCAAKNIKLWKKWWWNKYSIIAKNIQVHISKEEWNAYLFVLELMKEVNGITSISNSCWTVNQKWTN